MEIKIEKLKKTDINLLSKLFFNDKSTSEFFFTQFKNEKQMIAVLTSAKKDLFYLIKVKEKICGYMSLRGLDEGFNIPRFGIYIFSKFRNKGIGTKALELLLILCKKELNFTSIDLIVDKNNFKAIKIYKSQGFKLLNKEKNNLKMIKKIS